MDFIESFLARYAKEYEEFFEFDQLRRMRNELVHGIELPPADFLAEATQRLEMLIREIERRRHSR